MVKKLGLIGALVVSFSCFSPTSSHTYAGDSHDFSTWSILIPKPDVTDWRDTYGRLRDICSLEDIPVLNMNPKPERGCASGLVFQHSAVVRRLKAVNADEDMLAISPKKAATPMPSSGRMAEYTEVRLAALDISTLPRPVATKLDFDHFSRRFSVINNARLDIEGALVDCTSRIFRELGQELNNNVGALSAFGGIGSSSRSYGGFSSLTESPCQKHNTQASYDDTRERVPLDQISRVSHRDLGVQVLERFKRLPELLQVLLILVACLVWLWLTVFKISYRYTGPSEAQAHGAFDTRGFIFHCVCCAVCATLCGGTILTLGS